jgi:isocitrate dehydrogenase
MATYKLVSVPTDGHPIRMGADGKLQVPDRPILPFIEGDGTGADIWRASQRVFDAAVEKAYGGKRKIAWCEVFAGEKAFNRFQDWLPTRPVTAFREFLVGIKGPLTTPIGGGIRSLNVTLRQISTSTSACVPCAGSTACRAPSSARPGRHGDLPREHRGHLRRVEWAAETAEARKVIAFLQNEMGVKKIRFPETSGIGVKPMSREGTERLARAASTMRSRRRRRASPSCTRATS